MSDFQGVHEECGVFGLFSNNQTDAAGMAYYGLYALQHRGQESCGIVVNHDGLFILIRTWVWSARSLFRRRCKSFHRER